MRIPKWVKVKSADTHETKKLLRSYGVLTVCEEARCPNQDMCFSRNTAAFMILGDRCTRNCSFCGVDHYEPLPPDTNEPERVADAASALGLDFVVLTSVTRDDLPDGGALYFAETIQAVIRKSPDVKIEVLTPDFNGNRGSLNVVLSAEPDVFNHNIETVPRLYPVVRPGSEYKTSLGLLESAKIFFPSLNTKSGIMLGLGEEDSEVVRVMSDLREKGCDFLTIGQYLRPRKENTPVVEYKTPAVYKWYRQKALSMGFKAVAASPLTRSSMDAERIYKTITNKVSNIN
jgi:lipoic acid synthetase